MVALTRVRKRGRATPDQYEGRLCHKPNLQLEGYCLHQLTSPDGERGCVYLRKPTFEQPRKRYENPYVHRTPLQARVSAVNEYHPDQQPILNGKYFDLRQIKGQLHDLLCSEFSVDYQVQGTPYMHRSCSVEPEVYQSALCNRIIGLLIAFKALPDKRKDTEVGLSALGVAVEHMRYVSGLSTLVQRLLKTQESFALEMRIYACSHISQKVNGAVETIRTLRNLKTRAAKIVSPASTHDLTGVESRRISSSPTFATERCDS